ncbi:MAG: carboxypeptidase regulatory-like domain-containing protein [Bryobacteraceae bacterium]
MRLAGCVGALVFLWQTGTFGGSPPQAPAIDVAVLDQFGQPVPGVQVQLRLGQDLVASAQTDQNGHAAFTQLKPARYEIVASKDGFEPLHKAGLDLSQAGSVSIELTLPPTLARQDSVEVRGTASPLEQGASAPSELPAQSAKELPNRPATVADALPLIPGVVRSPGGGLQISGAGEHRSALIVNSADVTDPATGQFGLTVPIDRVETLNVYQTPFLAEYGRFTAGLVSVETRRAGDKWKWELNDPFPDFRIRSYQLRGLRDATPRLNLEGPLIPGKLYFSEGFEYEVRKTEVYELPFPDNQKKQEGINSFAQIDWIASDKQLVTATVHVAPQRLQFVNMNFFNPQPTTPDAGTHNYTATLADRLSLGGGLFENTVSAALFDARVWGQGSQDLVLTPQGNSGNYFAQQDRNASRLGWSSTYSFAPLTRFGTHNLKAGSYIAASSDRGQVSEHPIDILDPMGQLIERIAFVGGQPFSMSDRELALFAQDHWIVSPRLAVDLGLREESQQASEALRLAPRAGIAWSPFAKAGTVVRAGLGLFYDRVPLNVYSFDHYPNPVITLFNAAGQVSVGPSLYQNGLGEVTAGSPFVFQEPAAGNFSPRSATWSVQVEQPLWRVVKLRASYIANDASGLIVMNPVAPDPVTNTGAYLLSGIGRSRYRQFEITARVRLAGERQLFFSYVRSRARGDLNDFASYLGSFPGPIIRPNQFGNLPGDLPNRFLAWGFLRLPWGFRIAPLVEVRNGFPYAIMDVAQNYVGVPNQNRFPSFLSVDSRFSKDLKVSPKYTIRLSVSGYNLTNHFNPEALHANIADPAYGFYFGQRGRRFTADFDVIF